LGPFNQRTLCYKSGARDKYIGGMQAYKDILVGRIYKGIQEGIVVGLERQYNHRMEGVQMVMHLLTEELSVQVS